MVLVLVLVQAEGAPLSHAFGKKSLALGRLMRSMSSTAGIDAAWNGVCRRRLLAGSAVSDPNSAARVRVLTAAPALNAAGLWDQ
mmetsp:Transcript_47022/g.87342  ORF Transcript_47022/g.87342 Transcript_47022/m.87342 type:complete len:84 (-) Transcript_47022:578-829(-)